MRRDDESRSHYFARMELINEEFNSEKTEDTKKKTTSTDETNHSNATSRPSGGFSFPAGVRLIGPDEDLIWD